MERLTRIKLVVQLACLLLLAAILFRVLFYSVPATNQLLTDVSTQIIQPLSPDLKKTASNVAEITEQIKPKTATISTNLMEMSVRGRRIAIAEEENWNSPEKVRQRNEWMNGVSEALANANRLLPQVESTVADTRRNLDASFEQLNGQLLPQAGQGLQQVGVLLANLSTLAQTLNQNSGELLREADLATQQITNAGRLVNATLTDPRTTQVLRDLERISANGVTASEQIALMTKYGADTAQQAPELARRFNEIVKGAQGWQKVFNVLRLVASVVGIFW